MNGFWKKTGKRFSSALLALVLVLSLMPAAMAEPATQDHEHGFDSYGMDDSSHWQVCSDCGAQSPSEPHNKDSSTVDREATCYQKGTTKYTCSVCNYSWTEEDIPATEQHSYEGEWVSNDTTHQRKCVTPGCTSLSAAQNHRPINNGIPHDPTCTKDGYTEHTCADCGKTYTVKTASALGHTDPDSAGKCTRCHQIIHSHTYNSAWQYDNTNHWKECSCGAKGSTSRHTGPDAAGLCTVCGIRMGSATTYTATFRNGTDIYKTQANIAPSGKVTGLGTPSKPTPSNSNCTYSFYGWTEDSSGGSSKGVYTGQSGVYRSSSSVMDVPINKNVTYYSLFTTRATSQNLNISAGTTSGTTVGGSIRSEISSRFSSLTGQSSFNSVSFSNPRGSSYGVLYANSSKGSLGTGSYSYSSVANLYFVPGSSSGYTVNYTAADSYGNSVAGTITISGTSSSKSSTITYSVAPGGTVDFKTSDFREAYRAMSGDTSTPRWITFSPTSSYANFDGAIYSGSREMTRSILDDGTAFYYSDSDYGRYALNTLNFKATDRARNGDELSMTFEAWYNKSVSYKGTLKIVVDGKSNQDGDVTYRVAPGKSVTFDRSDFNEAYQELSGSSRTIRYVEFKAPSAYNSFAGKLNVSGKTDFTRNDLSYGGLQFYYNSSSYGDYALDDVRFTATSSARDGDTLEIPFRAYYSGSDYEEGALKIIIDKDESDDTVAYEVAPGKSVSFKRADFNEVYQDLSGSSRTIRYVTFSAPSSYTNFNGELYAGRTSFSRSDLTHSKTFFYYSDSKEGDYALDDLTFQATSSARDGDSISIPFRAYYSSSDYEEGTLKITVSTSSGSSIAYDVAPGGSVAFKPDDFNDVYRSLSGTSRTIRYVVFSAPSAYTSFAGSMYTGNTALTRSNLSYSQTKFYYSSSSYGSYALSSLSFRADSGAKNGSTLSIPFRVCYSDTDYEEGTLKITVNTSAGGDISYTVAPNKTVNFDRTDFNSFFRKTYSNYQLSYVEFRQPTTSEFSDSDGTFYTGYGTSYANSFRRTTLADARFYYNSGDAGRNDYALDDLTFAAASAFTGKVTLHFTAYGTNSRSVEGTVVITPAGGASSSLVGSIRYNITAGNSLQINANDLAKFYKKSGYTTDTLQYVTFSDVPAAGALYYNYYSASGYGTATREQITAANRSARSFYMSPTSASQYALTELTYVPSGSNYCAVIPFTAYGTGGRSVTGSILISVTSTAVSEVYGVTPKGVAVNFPASSIYTAVATATGSALSGIQLLKLPAANVGTVYVGSGNTPADTKTVYTYNTGTQQMGQLRFVPAGAYTGPVEIPYAALNASGVPIASGVFSLGVLNSRKAFSDVTTSTWCYKYVTELADASVIDGYANGSFMPNNTITYGAALKLVMLAAGYPEQAPTVKGSVFSGYLARAQADGLVTRTNVNLSAPITRLQVAQLAAGALKLDINNLSSVKPFTDTSDVYVQALNAAGIIEGYFSNGVSTYKPGNTLTRGQVSAIVWRMRNYNK